ncbi:MAG: hypothetical protein A2075_14550 [Geobacteraceae bacterium GWC2_58_44]|nr:MAG: hypothetical protein A2075_14550 [Geobacteraceae bacterium GWC2_58_44]HBG06731.1 hypothetical protein [Geobacter sp.]
MNHLKYRIVFALIIPVLFFNLSTHGLFGVAHALEKSENSNPLKISIVNVVTDDPYPVCPDDHQQNTEQSQSGCESPSVLYFGRQPLLISYNPNITTHFVTEPFKAMPEVYLDKFIPPQNLA